MARSRRVAAARKRAETKAATSTPTPEREPVRTRVRASTQRARIEQSAARKEFEAARKAAHPASRATSRRGPMRQQWHAAPSTAKTSKAGKAGKRGGKRALPRVRVPAAGLTFSVKFSNDFKDVKVPPRGLPDADLMAEWAGIMAGILPDSMLPPTGVPMTPDEVAAAQDEAVDQLEDAARDAENALRANAVQAETRLRNQADEAAAMGDAAGATRATVAADQVVSDLADALDQSATALRQARARVRDQIEKDNDDAQAAYDSALDDAQDGLGEVIAKKLNETYFAITEISDVDVHALPF